MSFAAAAPLLAALLATGFTGSLGHCSGMCGPLVIMVGARLPRQGLAAAPFYLLYHSGRIAIYALLGLIAGEFGALAGEATRGTPVPAIISLVLGLIVVLTGMSYLGWVYLPVLDQAGGWWRAATNQALRLPKIAGLLLMGALNGLLPCGLVYGALLAAIAIGNPWYSALGMLLFGLGTIPVLLLLGISAGLVRLQARQVLSRLSGAFIILVGAQLALRGVAQLGLVSHWMIGKVMIW